VDKADAGGIAVRMLQWAGMTAVAVAWAGAGTGACPALQIPASRSMHGVKACTGIPEGLVL